MGSYLDPGNEKFFQCINSEIYVDKTGLLEYCNRVLNTLQKYICVSRPRRFGKSVTADMLTAYYSRGCDSSGLFAPYEIAQAEDYEEHRNKYHVVSLNMQEFLSRTDTIEDMLDLVKRRVLRELQRDYPDIDYFDKTDLIGCMQDLYEQTGIPFVLVIDEWDCMFREHKEDGAAQKRYLDFLRDMFKDKACISLCYMTGILPIKKYGTHSALNMFDEFSMIFSGELSSFAGFTESEVRALCEQYGMDFGEMKKWYDGYELAGVGAIYNPRSVVSALRFKSFQFYWNQTETFEALRTYIDMNFEGLKNCIIELMNGGNRIQADPGSFTNDMVNFHSRDDVLTLLVHLGYLGYLSDTGEVFIPNHEILNEYATAVGNSDWGEVSRALKYSRQALEAVWRRDEKQVAEAVERAHFQNSHLQYNDENALSYTISLAFYAARNFYTVHREFPAGRGFADLVFLPRKQYIDRPALVVELKWNESAEGAIAQIRRREYCAGLKDYRGNLLLVGISYDKRTKKHVCVIEEL